MHDNNMKTNNTNTNNTNTNNFQPQEEFLRQVIFMKDDEKVLAIFPFYHNISDQEYEMVVGNFFNGVEDDIDIPQKRDFCLMHESEFGWGWIHNKMVSHLEIADEDEYADFKKILITSKVIKPTFILNLTEY
jgi:hypothetical protein